MRFITRPWSFFSRKIQADIVTLFLLLISSFSLIILAFIYNRNYQGILYLSNSMIEQVNNSVVQRIDAVANQAQYLEEITKGILHKNTNIELQQQAQVNYLLNALKVDPLVYKLAIATVDGGYVAAINISISNQNTYYKDPQKPLPNGVKYAVRRVDRSQATPTEIWEYKDADFQTLATEPISPASYDPRGDEWFRKMAAWPHTHWSTPFIFGAEESAMSLSMPVYDTNGKLASIINADLSLNLLSNYITQLQIGESGKAFIMEKNGIILIPVFNHGNSNSSGITPALMQMAFEEYRKQNRHAFLIEANQTKYIVNFADFPLSAETNWLVAVIVPFNDFFGSVIKTQKDTILIAVVILACFGVLVYFSSKHISVPIAKLASEVDKIQHFDFEEKEKIVSHIEEVIALSNSVSSMRRALHSFTRYVPKSIVKTLIEQGQEITLGGERRNLTILFSDIADFTTISESLPIEELMSSLEMYFDQLSKILVQSEGTIDKYIGDSIMAFWGAPQIVTDQADKACLASLRCLALTRKRSKENGFPDWPTRFGVHSGEVIVGNIGTSERINYTAIGNPVNTASRLQAMNKIYQTSIIISQTVQEQIGTRFATRPLDFVAVKGRKTRLTIYELVGTIAEKGELEATPEQLELCKAFTEAYANFYEGKIEIAKAQFTALHQKFPEDFPTKLYLERLQVTVQNDQPSK